MSTTDLTVNEHLAHEAERAEALEKEVADAESLHDVVLSYNPVTGRSRAEGKPSDIDAAFAKLKAYPRDQVAAVLRARLPIDEEAPTVREIPVDGPPSLAVQRENHTRWFRAKPEIYWCTPEEQDRMFGRCEEGDQILFDFMFSFTVRKPNGLLISVNRRGEIERPSPYSPHILKQSEK